MDSKPGEGTEFHVVLDLEKAQVQEEDMMLPSWKALVVDNDEILCRSAVSCLKEIGVEGEWVLDADRLWKWLKSGTVRAEITT